MRAEVSLVYKNEKKRGFFYARRCNYRYYRCRSGSFDHSGKSQNRSAGGGICN